MEAQGACKPCPVSQGTRQMGSTVMSQCKGKENRNNTAIVKQGKSLQ